MKVKVASKAGFCFGVKRAVEMARQCLKNHDQPLYTLGPIIHNRQVTDLLSQEGLINVDDLDALSGPGTLIIRSHGVAPEVLRQAAAKGLNVIDTTCPFVRKVQTTVQNLVRQNMPVVVVGDPEHPEVRGIVGWSDYKAVVIKDQAQARRTKLPSLVGVVAQTTQRLENLYAVIEVLQAGGSRVQAFNTICLATAERQKETLELAGQVNAMVVIGGKDSANTAKLVQICNGSGIPVYWVETANELVPAWFKGLSTVGITAGASTPGWIIEEVHGRMNDFNENIDNETETETEATNENETNETNETTEETVAQQSAGEQQPELTPEEAPGEDVRQEMADEADESQEMTESQEMAESMEVRTLRHGETVRGVVVQVNQDEVLVDVGAKSEGVIPLRELTCYTVNDPQSVVKVGDEIDVFVLKSEDNEGKLILSKERADAEKSWANLEAQKESGEPVKGMVREAVKGGLLVDVGVRAFLPASLVGIGYVEDLSKYLNQEIEARIIELNRSKRKIILSRKAILEEEHARNREQLLATLEEGQVVKGVVRRLTNFGAFVDIGGVDGLMHISEMAWYRINHPSDIVQAGDELDVMVLRVDRENEKVSLGLKQVLANPWEAVEQKYPVDSIIKAKVVRLAPFGAFVQLEPGVEGLIHISHLADHHVATPDEVVQEGEEIDVKVLSVDPGDKRIRLSIREINKETKAAQPKESAPKQPAEQTNNNDGGTATIGDLVGAIFDNQEE